MAALGHLKFPCRRLRRGRLGCWSCSAPSSPVGATRCAVGPVAVSAISGFSGLLAGLMRIICGNIFRCLGNAGGGGGQGSRRTSQDFAWCTAERIGKCQQVARGFGNRKMPAGGPWAWEDRQDVIGSARGWRGLERVGARVCRAPGSASRVRAQATVEAQLPATACSRRWGGREAQAWRRVGRGAGHEPGAESVAWETLPGSTGCLRSGGARCPSWAQSYRLLGRRPARSVSASQGSGAFLGAWAKRRELRERESHPERGGRTR